MPAIVAIPQVVKELLVQFGDLFPNEPARVHFAEYLTDLIVAERKTVSGISREFADTTDQSCLDRWLTEAKWDVERITAHSLEWLQQDPSTRYRPSWVHWRQSISLICRSILHLNTLAIIPAPILRPPTEAGTCRPWGTPSSTP
jgi:hypothetical protein